MRLTQNTVATESDPQWERVYADLLADARDKPALHSCFRCKYHSPLLCAVVPLRSTANFYAANECDDWMGKE
jgi:hypothetical protein